MTPDAYRTLMEHRIGEARYLMKEAANFAAEGPGVISTDARYDLSMLMDEIARVLRFDETTRRRVEEGKVS